MKRYPENKGLSSIAGRGVLHKNDRNSAPRNHIGVNKNELCSHGPQLSINAIFGPIGPVVAEIQPKKGGPQLPGVGVSDVCLRL